MCGQVSQDNLNLLESGILADFEIHCGERVFKVHKATLAARSKYFRSLLSGDYLENHEAKIRMDQVKPDIMAIALKFIYGGKLPSRHETMLGHDINLIQEACVSLWMLGDRLQMPNLMYAALARAKTKFTAILGEMWTYAVNSSDRIVEGYGRLALTHNADSKARIVVDIAMAIRLLYTSPPYSSPYLSHATMRAVSEYRKTLVVFVLMLRNNMQFCVLQGLVNDLPAFEKDLSKMLMGLHFNEVVMDAMNMQDPNFDFPHLNDFCANGGVTCDRCNRVVRFRRDRHTISQTRMAVNPLVCGAHRWCLECGAAGIAGEVDKMLSLVGQPVACGDERVAEEKANAEDDKAYTVIDGELKMEAAVIGARVRGARSAN